MRGRGGRLGRSRQAGPGLSRGPVSAMQAFQACGWRRIDSPLIRRADYVAQYSFALAVNCSSGTQPSSRRLSSPSDPT